MSIIGERLYEAYNNGDADAAVALYVENGTNCEVATGRVAEGRKAIRDGLSGFLKAIPDARWEPEHHIANDGGEAIAYRLTGTLTEQLGPFEARGQKVDLRGVQFLKIAGGEIIASDDYYDTGSLAAQLETS